MAYELKKCPFCGGMAKINEKYNSKIMLTFVEVTCLVCGGVERLLYIIEITITKKSKHMKRLSPHGI